MAAAKAPRKSQDEWERYKPQIECLWVQNKMTLKKLRDTMETEYKFIATTSQYQSQFKRWGGGFEQKRNIKKDLAYSEWRRVYSILKKRDGEGKKSQVFKFGKLVSDSDVKHEMGRYLCNLQYHQVGPLPEPSNDDILSVATPPPAHPQEHILALEQSWLTPALWNSYWGCYLMLKWPMTLPVFAFETNVLPKLALLLKIPDYHQQKLFLSPGAGPAGTPHHAQTVSHICHRQYDLIDLEHSWMTRTLLEIMPQTSAHVHFQTTELIAKGELSLVWMLRMLVYAIANNLHTYSTEEVLRTSDDRTLRLLEDLNISDVALKELRASGDAHALCLLEELFSCAVRLGDVRVAERLLQTGADPNQVVNFRTLACFSVTEEIWKTIIWPSDNELGQMSALLVAIASGNSAMATCLVQYGAMNWLRLERQLEIQDCWNVWYMLSPGSRFSSDPGQLCETVLQACRPSCEDLYIALQAGIMFGTRKLVQRMLQALRTQADNGGQILRRDCLLAAILVQDDDLVTELRDKGYNLKYTKGLNLDGQSPITLLLRKRFFLATELQEDAIIWAMIQMLESGANVNHSASNPHSPLHAAVQLGSVEVIELLLQYGGNLESLSRPFGKITETWETPLLTEAMLGNSPQVASLLLDRGVPSRVEDLALAINNEWADCADRLLYHLDDRVRHDLEACCSEILPDYIAHLFEPTPLSVAVMRKQGWASQWALVILERCPTLYDPQALWCAIYTGNLQHVETILQRRPARTHAKSDCVHEGTALALAVVAGFWEIVELLNRHGITAFTTSLAYTFWESWGNRFIVADFQGQKPQSRLRTEFTPLHWLIKARSEEGFQYMLQAGVNPDPGSLKAAIESGSQNWINKLLESGADVNVCHGESSCLAEAIKAGRLPIVRRILAAGAKVDETERMEKATSFYTTAFQTAVQVGNLELIELLVDAGANVNEPASARFSKTSLQMAAMHGRLGIAQRLLDLDADCNAPAAPNYGYTALEAAAYMGRLEIIRLLLDFGVLTDVSFRRQYIRAVKFALVQGHTAIFKILRNHRQWTNEDHELYKWEMLEME